jgi:hypothetical protein
MAILFIHSEIVTRECVKSDTKWGEIMSKVTK